MATYRKVDTQIWLDERFCDLTHTEKLVFLFLLTNPAMTSIGAMRASVPGLAAELDMDPEAFWKALGSLSKASQKPSQQPMVVVNERRKFVWLPNFLRYNPPESPNVVKAWVKAFDLVPECNEKSALFRTVSAYVHTLPEAFRKPFESLSKDLAEAFANQEQEQEQEQERIHTHTPRAMTDIAPGVTNATPIVVADDPEMARIPEDFAPEPKHRGIAEMHGLDLEFEFGKFVSRSRDSKRESADWSAAFCGWLYESAKRSQNQRRTGPPGATSNRPGFDDVLRQTREEAERRRAREGRAA